MSVVYSYELRAELGYGADGEMKSLLVAGPFSDLAKALATKKAMQEDIIGGSTAHDAALTVERDGQQFTSYSLYVLAILDHA